MSENRDFDVLIIGAGVLGVSIAYWLSSTFDVSVAIADSAEFPGAHTTSRNTGVIHRPFYLDPQKKRVFARTSLVSRQMWQELAESAGLPWRPIGTLNVGLDDSEVKTLERYGGWGVQNGMEESELEILDGSEVKEREPEVRCRAALLSKTDVSVDFGVFTRHICKMLISNGVRFLRGHEVSSAHEEKGGAVVEAKTATGHTSLRSKIVINAAGGGALNLAHKCGLALDCTALNFRGEYWVVDEPFASRVGSNVYRPPQFPHYPFLDPHFVVRADGSRQIGPNAVLVSGPYAYSGLGRIPSFFDLPFMPKAKLLANPDFARLVAGEWRSSLSKDAMCGRVRRFVPSLSTSMLHKRAVFGVRSSVLNRSGFVPEAMLLKGRASLHIVNFNSPGATGAPAFSAMVVEELRTSGMIPSPRGRPRLNIPGWDYESVLASL